jgi:mannan endo-1,4-beta-mannosidase
MNPSFFLNEIFNAKIGVCAWVWKYDGQDANALLNNAGFPNDNSNNNWGTVFKNYAGRARN